MAFIEKLDGQSLNLSQEEFELYMSGQASPQKPLSPSSSSGPGGPLISGSVSGSASGAAAKGHRTKHLDLLTGLDTRQEKVLEGARRLERDLIDWCDGVEHGVQDVLEKFPLDSAVVAAATDPTAIDSENVENDKLPPPLTPQMFGR